MSVSPPPSPPSLDLEGAAAEESVAESTSAAVVVDGSAQAPKDPPHDPLLALAGVFLGGLAFFFLGVDGIKSNLRQLTSRRFRAVMGRLTANAPLAAMWGVIFGAITQSATAVSFIMVGMISSGLLAMRRALLVVSWANAGTVLLVFVAAIDIRAAVLYLIGISGLLIVFDLVRQAHVSARVLLSVGMLLLGLKLMSDATKPFPEFEWFESLTAIVHDSTFGVFLFGAVLRLVVQSSSAIVVIGIAFAGAGLLDEQQVLLLMNGTAVGVGGTVFLLSGKAKGTARQIALYQGLVNAAIGLVLLGTYWLEPMLGVPLMRSFVDGDGSLQSRLAVAFLGQQTLVALLGTALLPMSDRILSRLAPITREEQLEQVAFISAASTDDVDTALVLIEREQARLIGFLPHYLDRIRTDGASRGEAAGVSPSRLLEASRRIAAEIRGLEAELAGSKLDSAAAERLLRVQRVQELASSLQEILFSFGEAAASIDASGGEAAAALRHNLVESLDTIVQTAVAVFAEPDELEIQLLQGMTADRGDLMERIRTIHLAGGEGMPIEARSSLLYLTTLFERIVWTIGQLGRSIPQVPA
ncbi:MAG: Na/Pi symporter [Phycisphaerales bacterium]